MSPDRAKAMLGLRIATAIYVERRAMLKAAVSRAMQLLRWPDQSAAEVERVMAEISGGISSVNFDDITLIMCKLDVL